MSETTDDELERIRQKRRAELLGETEAEEEPAEVPSEPVYVDGQDAFADVLDDHDVVLVDFYADWCGPCKMLEPILEGVAADSAGVVAKVDVDQNQRLAAQYNVQSIPTMVLFSGGEPVERIVGVRDQAQLTQLVDRQASA